ncbi:polysaccharide pyruvyl transferase family protein [Vibrio parahaemolyticus]|uniref:polysaccharide pyruvyl transferase family protein n=2 Tax=Vibrio parahaemolyticus TaxID=670 RepID=UPI00111FD461|nr:polysaccharide pyruvyl transferase family protein [Vibrio parahaemolyticus]EGQ8807481.1 polysaccharide pyruvyl transferase family protein [Vibrio parahaemolyticus]EGQ8890578.1 polysaccharide pyruvyl transferase family protein [Vibrio parahaemolyticus]EGQ8964820.1 polysaccharide pyruvyl transferase family protein [Vibrio parahaemolyticus]EGR2855740.1 polysaccharide pyruvyl transferase family protein [Vibrio parahaemolyticus]EGR3472112.1 polysaccharide pyruvyl transferase family protein [Vibr
MKSQVIAHIDPSICSLNIGDHIISDAVKEKINEIFPSKQIVPVQSQDSMFVGTYRVFKYSELSLVGGTNLLSGNMPFYRQWKISPIDLFFKNEIVLMGVGWWQYQPKINFYTKWLLRSILSKKYIHSVRDDYTKNMLNSIGFDNVINTSCATMWDLTKEHCEKIPKEKSDSVIFTITDYLPDHSNDIAMIKTLKNYYKRVVFWPQGHKDISYFKELSSIESSLSKVEVLNPNLDEFNQFLDKNNVDFVGTRLHAGIRALQKLKRTIIVSIDNRAKEKSKDFNLITVERGDISGLENLINENLNQEIVIPADAILQWRSQFEH